MIAIIADIIASVEPQQTVISRSGSTCDALSPREFLGDCVAQGFCTPGDGVLIDVGRNRFLRRALDLDRRGKIREILATD